jgi:hypothetical protein
MITPLVVNPTTIPYDHDHDGPFLQAKTKPNKKVLPSFLTKLSQKKEKKERKTAVIAR